MNVHARTSAIALACLTLLTPALSSAQDQRSAGNATASIAGRITLGNKPVAGVAIALVTSDTSTQQPPVARVRTDEQGYYRITGIPPGRYIVSPLAPGYITPAEINQWRRGKSVIVQEGESVESVDIQLIRGGVITGRVIDAEGRPMIGVRVRLEDQNQRQAFFSPSSNMYQTDDRGIYRLYGVPEGRYTVSVGEDTNQPTVRVGFGGNYYPLTFHPDTNDKSMASIVEVTAGGEATGIDIKVGRHVKSFSVAGRVIDTRTGKPVVGATCGYSPVSPDGRRTLGYGMGYRTDSAGNFRIEGILPGRYAAFSVIEGDNDSYSEPVVFQVENEDVRGLEIKLIAGCSISGVAVVEGTDDPDMLARLSQLQIYIVRPPEGGLTAPRVNPVRISPDGSFRIGGLQPGKVSIEISSYPVQKGFSLARIERDGAELRGPIEIASGEHITGVRAVIAYGNLIVRGQIKVEGGALPDDTRFQVVIHKNTGGVEIPSRPAVAMTDERGRFFIDGLVAGDYEITVTPFRSTQTGNRMPQVRSVKKAVTVGPQSETDVTIIVNLREGDKDN